MRLSRPFRWLIRRASAMHRIMLRSGLSPAPLRRNVLLLTPPGGGGGEIAVPLFYAGIGEKLYVVASFGGNDEAPRWYRELQREPRAHIEHQKGSRECRTRTLEPEETVEVWPLLLRIAPSYARCQRRTTRWIPVVELIPSDFS